MLISMRSTVVIDDQLFRRAKRRAADLNVSLSDVINQALREALAKAPAEPPPFEMVTFGSPESAVHHEPSDYARALLEEDAINLRR